MFDPLQELVGDAVIPVGLVEGEATVIVCTIPADVKLQGAGSTLLTQ